MGKLTKDELRRQLSAKRPLSSHGLSEKLIALAQDLDVQSIASYVPLASEPDVSAFNSWANGKSLSFPRIDGDDLIFSTGELLPGPYGLMEPTGACVEITDIELVVVPALAADRTGNRLGKGKGFYDRVLPRFKAVKVAVVFEEELLDELPTQAHDMPVDYVVTPNQIIKVGS